MKLPKGITKVITRYDMGDTPAAVRRLSGVLYINGNIWPSLTKEQKIYVLLHEEGHVVLNTRNEKEADRYADSRFKQMGYKLTDSVKAITRVLPFTTPEHYERARAQFKRAAWYDYHFNGNQKVKKYL